MSSLYEDEVKRLIKEKKSRIRELKKQGAKSTEIDILQDDIKLLEAELKHYQKALERFRAKPIQPSAGQGESTS